MSTEGVLVTDKAVTNIGNAVAHCERLRDAYGDGPVAAEAFASLARSLAFALQAQRLWGEDEESLGGTTAYGLTFGVIAHVTRNTCTLPGCPAFVRGDGSVGWWRTPEHSDHTWTRPVGSVDPVSWSVHS